MPYLVGKRTVYRMGECRKYYNVSSLQENYIQDYTVLKNLCRVTGEPFTDPLFNPDDPNIDLIGDIDLLSQGVGQWDGKFIWKRPRDVKPADFEGDWNPIFQSVKGFSKDDIQQGGLGDCWYLSSLSAIVDHKELLEFVIPSDNRTEPELGIYHFRFWHKGIYIDVVVDDRLPYVKNKGILKPAFTQNNGTEIWPMIIEKAYAKLHKSYSAIEGGLISQGLEDFTGGISILIEMKKNPKNIFERVANNFTFGNFIGFSTSDDTSEEDNLYTISEGQNYLQNYGLISGHAYCLVGMAEVALKGETIQLIELRNPWGLGSLEWNGDWGDNSELWNEICPCERKALLEDKEDGKFWISFDDATNLKYFSFVDICHWINDLDESLDTDKLPVEFAQHDGLWRGAAGGIENIFKNPQYVIQLKEGWKHSESFPGCMLLISLLRKDYVEKKDDIPNFGFHIYKIKTSTLDKMNLQPPFQESNLQAVFNPATGLMGGGTMREMNRIFSYDEGYYVIIPFIEKAGEYGDFLLRIVSEGNMHTEAVQAKDLQVQFSQVLVKNAQQNIKMRSVCGTESPEDNCLTVSSSNSKLVEDSSGDIDNVLKASTGSNTIAAENSQPDDFEEKFLSATGKDNLINRVELRKLLNLTCTNLPNFNGFGIETTRALMSVADYEGNGTLDYLERCQLANKLKRWIGTFIQFDINKNGYLNFLEFWSLLNSMKTPLQLNSIQSLFNRLASSDQGIDLDNYIFAYAKIDTSLRTFRENRLDQSGTVVMNQEQWLTSTIFY